eukprot:Sspe_Gene.51703::Locus_28680_Transcript_1_1_Confidence_1.000_Length_1638::g.51703::m.51703
MGAKQEAVVGALTDLYNNLSRKPAQPIFHPLGFFQDTGLAYESIFSNAMGVPPDPPVTKEKSDYYWDVLVKAAESSRGMGAAIATMLGLAIGDAIGHPLEFVPVDPSLPDASGNYPPTRPHLCPELGPGNKLEYKEAFNKFDLLPGQWTDDCSMALCLADSLLVNRGYHGGDARVRWHMWWSHGYCNAFRFMEPYVEEKRKFCPRGSVGLGGNIAQSICEVEEQAPKSCDDVPAIYGSCNEDAGNGSIMRLAPVPIAYHRSPADAEAVAEKQSRGTHPGPDAVACCKFMTYFITKSLKSHTDGDAMGDIKMYLDKTIAEFIKSHPANKDTGMAKLHALLTSSPPSPTECNWDWKNRKLEIIEAIRARKSSRDGKYNGYPVIPTYWGAYCMDGLAMALWGLHHSNGFDETIWNVVNLLGDADTTGAIVGQMAGAFYGWEGIASSERAKACLRNLREWDPYAEVGLRAALLYQFPPEHVFHPKSRDS